MVPSPRYQLQSATKLLLFSKGSSNSGTTLQGGKSGGKALFSSFKVGKTSERPFRANCVRFSVFYKMKLDTILSTLNRICVPGGVKGQMNDPQFSRAKFNRHRATKV